MRKSLVFLMLLFGWVYTGKGAPASQDSSQVTIRLIRVNGGTYTPDKKSGETTGIKLQPYYISAYEITNEQWWTVMGKTCDDSIKSYPKGNVSYTNCLEFIRRLNKLTKKNFDLPSEAQWEYAAKSRGDASGYVYSGSQIVDEVAWHSDTTSHEVGQKKPNALGLYDMSGNVFEWCKDEFVDPLRSRKEPHSSKLYVIRGGAYNRDSTQCQVVSRRGVDGSVCKPEYGLRLVCVDSTATAATIVISLGSPDSTNDRFLFWGGVVGFVVLVIVLVTVVVIVKRRRKKTVPSVSGIETVADNKPKEPADSYTDSMPPVAESENKQNQPLEQKESPCTKTSSATRQNSFAVDEDNYVVVGASVRGKGHLQSQMPCQDNHKYTYWGNGWGIAVVSDGAGSAENSQIGSKLVVERASVRFEAVVKAERWIERKQLPSDGEWAQLAYSVLRSVYDDMYMFGNSRHIEVKSLNATAIVLIHSPWGILATHIGDGRAGYRNGHEEWKPVITPHKGDEANQTIFITSQFWGKPSFRMSGRLIPESVVVREPITAFVLMSDGCESPSWQVAQMNRETGKVYDPNLPFAKFFDSVSKTLTRYHYEHVNLAERADSWHSFLDEGKAFEREIDDKTMIIGVVVK